MSHLILALVVITAVGFGFALGAATKESTLAHVRAQRDGYRDEVLRSVDDLTFAENARFAAEVERDQARTALAAVVAEHRDGPGGPR